MILKDISSEYSESLVKLLSKNLPDMLWVKDIEGNYLYANEAICNGLLMAKDTNEPIGKNDVFFATREREKHKDNPTWHTFGELCFNSDLEVIAKNKPMRFEEYGNVKGKMMYLEVNKAPFYDDDGKIIGTVGSGRDVTDYKLTQIALEEETHKLNESQRIGNIGTWEIDLITGLATWSDTLYRIYGEDKETYTPSVKALAKFLSYEDNKNIRNSVKKCIRNHSIEEMPCTVNRRDGKVVHLLTRSEAIYNDEGKAIKLLGSSMDVTAEVELKNVLKKQKENFEYQANHDILTKLPNRVLFLDRLKQSIYSAKRSNKKIAVLFIDLDHFKEINDSLGHDIGDGVLIGIANRMKNKLRDSDTIARLGGDEFCVILNNINEISDIAKIIEEGMRVVEEPILMNEHVLHIGMSVGVSMYPEDGQNEIELLKNADAAMYKAKANGRNTYWFYDESMTKDATKYLILETAMRKGLKNNEFLPYFQPQVDMETNSLVGMELLVRWQHPEKGLISPSEFIPIAQKTGLIVDLDRYLLDKSLALLSSWKKAGLKTVKLSINLVAKNLEDSSFCDVLIDIIKKHDCDVSDLELEVTEGSIMKNPESAIVKLNNLKNLGLSIAIDDFGTGYSSLSYLKKFPISKLKIDRSFVMDIPKDEDDKGIVKTIIGLCEILKIDVIAEGVETKEQTCFLLENGCKQAQGFLYSKPLSAQDMFEYLKASC